MGYVMSKTAPMASFEEFLAEYNRQSSHQPTYESAYIAAETWHKNQFGYQRFSNYGSFRVAKIQQRKKKEAAR